MIELKLIKHALALGWHRNFARAAEALHMTQPSLSRSIAALEEAVGAKLFDRGHKGVEPTAFGRVLLERGEALLGGEAELRREIQLLAGLETGLLAIGAGPYAGDSVAAAAARLSHAHPRLKIQILTLGPEAVAREVLAARCDLGVADVATLGDETRLSLVPLSSHKLYLACRPGHPLTRISELSLENVLTFPLVSTLFRGSVALAAIAGGAFGSRDPETGDFAPAILVNSLDIARRIARESDALFPGTAAMLAPETGAGHLVRLPFHVPVMQTSYGLMYLRDRTLSPAARRFMELVHEVDAELVAAEGRGRAVATGRRRVSAA